MPPKAKEGGRIPESINWCRDTFYSLLPLPPMGNNKNKGTSSQPGWVGRPPKAWNKAKPAIDPPVPLPKSCPKPRPKCRSVLPEPDVPSAENESDAILAATEGLLGLSKAPKTHTGDASEVDSNSSSTPSDMDVDGGGAAIDLDEDEKTSKSSDSDGEEEDEGKLFVSSV